jgi:hypothetical protein
MNGITRNTWLRHDPETVLRKKTTMIGALCLPTSATCWLRYAHAAIVLHRMTSTDFPVLADQRSLVQRGDGDYHYDCTCREPQ